MARGFLLLLLATTSTGCSALNPLWDPADSGASSASPETGAGGTGAGDETTSGSGASGDGDVGDGTTGDSTTGDGTTGDGTTGDGDGATGDGDGTTGDGTTGDGDGALPCGSGDSELLACYPFETPENGVADDSGPFSIDGVAVGVAAVAGMIAGAGAFDIGSSVVVPHHVEFLASEMTMAVWVQVDAMPGLGRATLMLKPGQMELSVTDGGKFRCGVPGTGALTAGSVVLGSWTHVACVFDGQVRMYQDGAPRGMVGAPGPALPGSTDPLELGGATSGEAYRGRLDEARVYKAALSVARICQLATC